jgi:Na+/proline symporter
MTFADWIVLGGTLTFIAAYGLWRGRGSGTMRGFLLADRGMRWPTVALAIMATQASAITFVSTPGQGFVDGLRFVQFYLGLPLAMIILSISAVPRYHSLGVYSAYEYLERRFDPGMRIFGTLLFLVSRGLGAGMTIYAPALVLSVMLHMDIRVTSLIIGGVVILYTTTGGIKAVNHTDVFQLLIILTGMVAAFVAAVQMLPDGISFGDALAVAGASGKLRAIDTSFSLEDRYTFWSGLIGGMFVALAYFGTDQSQVQRYLTGKSVAQSRMALLFNGMAKVPMQFFILLLGVMVFVVFQFHPQPLTFNPNNDELLRAGNQSAKYAGMQQTYQNAQSTQEGVVRKFVESRHAGDTEGMERSRDELAKGRAGMQRLRTEAAQLLVQEHPTADPSDTNYIFLSFVMHQLPAGLIGLLFACIFAASMSSSSGELSALATISIIDIYRRFYRKDAEERHYVRVSRIFMAAWGIYGIAFAQYASRLGSLIEAVNILGSLFYGTMLGVFLLAFYFRTVGGRAALFGGLAGQVAVFLCFFFTPIAWLWYNVVGCLVVIVTALAVSVMTNKKPSGAGFAPEG